MIVAALIALLGLTIVAASTRPGDGHAETAIAVPLVAAGAVLVPVAGLATLVGAGVAFAVLGVVERRTLWYGRRLRAVAAIGGAVVPLGVLAASALFGPAPSHPELWLVGAVVPGVLVDDVRRQSRERRGALAVGGAATFLALALSGLVLRGTVAGADLGTLIEASAGAGVGAGALAVVGVVLLGGLAAGTLARWRYGLHVGPLSIPLLAVWSLDGALVPAAYLLAGVAGLLAIAALQPRLCLPGRQLSATAGLFGATLGAVAALAGAPLFPAVFVGALAAEDARIVRRHAGADLLDSVALGGSLYVLTAVALVVATGSTLVIPGGVVALGATGAALTAGLVVARRERDRPSELELRAADARWVP